MAKVAKLVDSKAPKQMGVDEDIFGFMPMTAVMISIQGASSVSAEIGTMRLREEIDALELMAVSPESYVLLPRLIGFIVVTPCLALISGVAAIGTGFFVATEMKGVGYGEFVNNLYTIASFEEIFWAGINKAIIFGVAIGLIATYQGWSVRGSAREVGRAANLSVVHSIMPFFVLNALITNFFFGIQR